MILILPDNVSAKEKRKKTIRNPSNGEKKKNICQKHKKHEISSKTEAKIIKIKNYAKLRIAVVVKFHYNKESRRKFKIGQKLKKLAPKEDRF